MPSGEWHIAYLNVTFLSGTNAFIPFVIVRVSWFLDGVMLTLPYSEFWVSGTGGKEDKRCLAC